MAELTLEALGFTKEELQKRVVDQLCEQIMESKGIDEDGDEVRVPTTISRQLTERVKKTINERIDAIAEKHVIPHVTEFVDNLVLQQTNQWGEKTGKPVTLIEFLVAKCDAYMREPVDYNGKTKDQDSYNWRQHSTRITHLINGHFQFHIEKAMQEALKTANSSIAGGIQDAVKVSLAGILQGIKTSVTVK